ncbi:hypothetical protein GQ44DRAFT_804389, partial [Phaeosphaeriaceae sp. PMI808]
LRQACSWLPLQITRTMLLTIMDKYAVMPEIYDLLGCFCDRAAQTEEGFSSPLHLRQSSSVCEISYGYRYAEKKPIKKGNPWVIRQSGIYHRLDLATGRSLYIVCSPVLQSAFEQRLFQLLNTSHFQMDVLTNPLLLHHMFVSTHLGDLRNYALHFEQQLERIWNNAITTDISEVLTVGHESLSYVRYIADRILPLEPMTKGVERILGSLEEMRIWICCQRNLSEETSLMLKASATNLSNEASAYRNNAAFILQRVQVTAQVISDSMTFQHQAIAHSQNQHMATLADSTMKDSVNIRVITFVTLFYLPFSFIAVSNTILGMNLFNFDTKSHHLVVSTQFWIYFVIALPLTTVTLIFWKWKTWRHQRRRSCRLVGKGPGWRLDSV